MTNASFIHNLDNLPMSQETRDSLSEKIETAEATLETLVSDFTELIQDEGASLEDVLENLEDFQQGIRSRFESVDSDLLGMIAVIKEMDCMKK